MICSHVEAYFSGKFPVIETPDCRWKHINKCMKMKHNVHFVEGNAIQVSGG